MNVQSRMVVALSTTLMLLILLLCISNLPTIAHAYPKYAYRASAQTTIATTAPTGALRINGEALATTAPTVTLLISATAPISPVTAMRLRSGSGAWEAWQQYTETVTYTLPFSTGVQTVYAQVRDAAGSASPIVSDSIRLDTTAGVTPRVVINNNAIWTRARGVTLTVGAPAGTTQMQIRNDTAFTDTAWQPFDTQPAWTLSPTHTATVYLRLRTVDSTLTDSINYDTVAPTGSVTISATTPHTMQLSLAANDSYSGVSAMRIGTYNQFENAEWRSFTSTATITRSVATDTPPRVAAQFRDAAGNVSQRYVEGDWFVFLPLASKQDPPVDVCAPIEGAQYTTITPNNTTDRPAEVHADLNLALRGYEKNPAAAPTLVNYDGATDSKAPQLYGLFGDRRTPTFGAQYQVYHWDWDCNCKGDLNTDWPATLSGMKVSPGEPLYVPDSGYQIGTLSGGFEALVLYASENRITLKYTRDDNVIHGYTLHVENVCVEPRLLALYEQWNAAGRDRLPALRAGQAFGRARGKEIQVAIRDTGLFLDPRSRKDWWQGRQATLSISREHVPPSAVGQ